MHTNYNIVLEQLKKKDKKAFEELFKSQYEPLVQFTYKYLNDIDEAEEVVQETFYKLWEKSREIDIEISLKSYLYQSVRNASLNIIKHKSVERKYIKDSLHNKENSTVNFMEIDELKTKISEAVSQLPPACKEVFELSRYEQKKHKEIAEQLNISVKTVENHVGKALKILKKSLKEYLPIYFVLLCNLIDIGI